MAKGKMNEKPMNCRKITAIEGAEWGGIPVFRDTGPESRSFGIPEPRPVESRRAADAQQARRREGGLRRRGKRGRINRNALRPMP